MENFEGYLFCKLQAIGSRSEGPRYFLQLFEPMEDDVYPELVIVKKVESWEEDPALHKFLNTKVVLKAEESEEGLKYADVSPWKR